MNKFYKRLIFALYSFVFVFCLVSCGNFETDSFVEKISLAQTVLNETEFYNDENISLNNNGNTYIVSGKIQKMTDNQISAFGDQTVTHMIVIKFEFDKEKTISSFEMKGNQTKVYSIDSSVENYYGKLTDLLDNNPSDDAFCYLILSALTNEYVFTSKYTDGTTSVINLKVEAELCEES